MHEPEFVKPPCSKIFYNLLFFSDLKLTPFCRKTPRKVYS